MTGDNASGRTIMWETFRLWRMAAWGGALGAVLVLPDPSWRDLWPAAIVLGLAASHMGVIGLREAVLARQQARRGSHAR